jgi:hypothetical protein
LHKGILAAGPRKSEYFATLFKGDGRFAESSSNTSQVVLTELEAKAFPHFLDYIYSGDADLVISTETATALHNLGGYFEARRLRWESKAFWQRDMNAKNCGTYYEHAKILNDEKVLVAATEKATAEIKHISRKSRLLHVTDESFWLKLIQTPPAKKHSRHVSLLLGVYFSKCVVSLEAFTKLTSSESLRRISRDGAIKLMDAERTLFQPEVSKLTDLQKRCIQAIADDWITVDEINQSDVQLLQKQSPLVLTETICRFSKAAKHHIGRFKLVPSDHRVEKKKASQRASYSSWVCSQLYNLGHSSGPVSLGPGKPIYYLSGPENPTI